MTIENQGRNKSANKTVNTSKKMPVCIEKAKKPLFQTGITLGCNKLSIKNDSVTPASTEINNSSPKKLSCIIIV